MTRRLLLILLAVVLGGTNALAPRWASALTQQQLFIQKVAPGAQKGWDDFRVPASVTIARAILETGWGTSELAVTYNNYFGIKCRNKDIVEAPYQLACAAVITTEYDPDGTPYHVVAWFRTYTTPSMSMIDPGYFLSTSDHYDPAFAFSMEPVKFADAMHDAGYATDPTTPTTCTG